MARPYITIVTGLPHSGASVVLEALRAGGIPIVDGSVSMGEHGPQDEATGGRVLWSDCLGKAMRLPHERVDTLTTAEPIRLIVMLRDLGELADIRLQRLRDRAALTRSPQRDGGNDPDDLRERLLRRHQRAWRHLSTTLAERANIEEVLTIAHLMLAVNPLAVSDQVSAFLDRRVSAKAIAQTLRPAE